MNDFFTCRKCVDLLIDYLEGALDPATHRLLEEHLSACPPCLNFLSTYRCSSEITQHLKEQTIEIPVDLEQRFKSFVKQQLKL